MQRLTVFRRLNGRSRRFVKYNFSAKIRQASHSLCNEVLSIVSTIIPFRVSKELHLSVQYPNATQSEEWICQIFRSFHRTIQDYWWKIRNLQLHPWITSSSSRLQIDSPVVPSQASQTFKTHIMFIWVTIKFPMHQVFLVSISCPFIQNLLYSSLIYILGWIGGGLEGSLEQKIVQDRSERRVPNWVQTSSRSTATTSLLEREFSF